ncbi:unnamed protein product, partial [marine sediment metagenome]
MFDSGGISIKPPKNMEKMKSDMAGAATVAHTLFAAARLKLPVNLVALIPAVENLPGSGACRPGDIIRYPNGKSVEITHTDAEGRLILADALLYAGRYKPAAVIDLATLTGACIIALGEIATGMLGNDENLMKRIKDAGEKTFERVWQLPMWEEYALAIKGDIADINNVGNRGAGTITGAMFLSNFVGKTPWVHLDIAGTSFVSKESA